MITSFGQSVVGGSLVVGLVIFFILVIIQFVVITNGSSRVSEVAARFTLDAMPGKQMAIDADLNAGLISDGEARRRRNEIAQEADFFGAMDGASKFVKGDAIAGLIITTVNLIGGLAIGMTSMGLSAGEAMKRFALLTIGDGLVSQIPALLISIAAGIIVTRSSASEHDLGSAVASEFAKQQRAFQIAGVALAALGALPGCRCFRLRLSAASSFSFLFDFRWNAPPSLSKRNQRFKRKNPMTPAAHSKRTSRAAHTRNCERHD